jgi:hypothetical protein
MRVFWRVLIFSTLGLAALLATAFFALTFPAVQRQVALALAHRAGLDVSIESLSLTAQQLSVGRGSVGLPDGSFLSWQSVSIQGNLLSGIPSQNFTLRSVRLEDLTIRPAVDSAPSDRSAAPSMGEQSRALLAELSALSLPAGIKVDLFEANGVLHQPSGERLEFSLQARDAHPGHVLQADMQLRAFNEAELIYEGLLQAQLNILLDRFFSQLDLISEGTVKLSTSSEQRLPLRAEVSLRTPATRGGQLSLLGMARLGPNSGQPLGEARLNLQLQTTTGQGELQAEASIQPDFLPLLDVEPTLSGVTATLQVSGRVNLPEETFRVAGTTALTWEEPGQFDPSLSHLPRVEGSGRLTLEGEFTDPFLAAADLRLGEAGGVSLINLSLQQPLPLLRPDSLLLSGTSGEVLRLNLQDLPLRLLQPWLGDIQIGQGTAAGRLSVAPEADGWLLRTDGVTLRDLNLKSGETLLLERGELRLSGRVKVSASALQIPELALRVSDQGKLLADARLATSLQFGDEGVSLRQGNLSLREENQTDPLVFFWSDGFFGPERSEINSLRVTIASVPPTLRSYLRNAFGVEFASGSLALNFRQESGQTHVSLFERLALTNLSVIQEGEVLLDRVNLSATGFARISDSETVMTLTNLTLSSSAGQLLEVKGEWQQPGPLGALDQFNLQFTASADPGLWRTQPLFSPLRLPPGAFAQIGGTVNQGTDLSANLNLRLQGVRLPDVQETVNFTLPMDFRRAADGNISAKLPLEYVWKNRRSRLHTELSGSLSDDLGQFSLRAEISIPGADLEPLIGLSAVWDDPKDSEKTVKAPSWTNTNRFDLAFSSGALFLNEQPFVRNSTAQMRWGEGQIQLENLRAELLSGNLQGQAGLRYVSRDPQPVQMAVNLGGRGISARDWAIALNPRERPNAEGVFQFEAGLTGNGLDTRGAIDALVGQITLSGTQVRIRALEGGLRTLAAEAGGAGGRLLGQLLNRPGIGALTSLVPLLSDLSFTSVSARLLRPEDQITRLEDLLMIGEQLRVRGRGAIQPGPVASTLDRRMQIVLEPASRGDAALHFNTLRLGLAEADPEGFFPWARPVVIGGTPRQPDLTEIFRTLQQAVLGALLR